MKKISVFTLLVLAALFLAAPLARAQEVETEAQKKAKTIAALVDEDQLGNFLNNLDPESLAEYVQAVVDSGNASLIDAIANALDNMGTSINDVLAPANEPGPAAGVGEPGSAASAIADQFGDAEALVNGDDFTTDSPVVNSNHLSQDEEDLFWF